MKSSSSRVRPQVQSAEVLDTRERILEAATTLFHAHGYAGTSIRMITSLAQTPVALVNYHFGSKQGLMDAVMERAQGRDGGARLHYLDKLEAEAGDNAVAVHTLVEAFLSSALRLTQRTDLSGAVFKQLVARSLHEPSALGDFIPKDYEETIDRYVRAFGRALPHLSQADVVWRLYAMVALAAYVIAGKDTMGIARQFGMDALLGAEPAQVLERLVPFLVAGFSGPASAALAGTALPGR